MLSSAVTCRSSLMACPFCAIPRSAHPAAAGAQGPCTGYLSTLSNSTTRLVLPDDEIVYTYIAAAVNKTTADASCDALKPHPHAVWTAYMLLGTTGAYGGGYAENKAVGAPVPL